MATLDELEKIKAELEAELERVNAEIEKRKEMSTESVYGTLQQIGNQCHVAQNSADIWKNTPLKHINTLKPDFSGKMGEQFVERVCQACEILNTNTGDKNSKDGTYDQKIMSKKVEIKTARLGGGKYQHETLKMEGCDFWLFLDVHPNGGFMTIMPQFDLMQRHPITGTTPTRRKGTTDVFKWDFTEPHLKKLVTAGMTFEFDKTTPMCNLGEFMKSKLA